MKNWKKIPGFSKYEISNMGDIKTFNHYNKGKIAIMKPSLDNCGYLRTMLIGDDNKYHTVKVHRLVAISFIPNLENKAQVNHKNGIRSDNRVLNLEWCTASENSKHAYNFLNRKRLYGEDNPSCKVSTQTVIEIRKNYVYGKKNKQGYTKKELAEKYNISLSSFKSIIQGKTWKHLL